MKRYPSLLMSVLLAGAACSGKPTPKAAAYAFSYHGDYYPSFIPSCTISITAQDTVRRMGLAVFQFRDTVKTLAFARSATLSPADLAFFFAKLKAVPLLTLPSTKQTGTDGITVYNTVQEGSQQHQFQFWSPGKDRHPQQHRVVEAVLGLYRRKFPERRAQEYVESLEQYFDFGLPCRITSCAPFEVRMYGSLSSSEAAELTDFVQRLPSDRPVLIDVTNFEGMGTMFYPLFRKLLTRNHRIVWVAPENREQLREIGVAASRITASTADGRALVQQLATSH